MPFLTGALVRHAWSSDTRDAQAWTERQAIRTWYLAQVLVRVDDRQVSLLYAVEALRQHRRARAQAEYKGALAAYAARTAELQKIVQAGLLTKVECDDEISARIG